MVARDEQCFLKRRLGEEQFHLVVNNVPILVAEQLRAEEIKRGFGLSPDIFDANRR